MWPRKGLQGIEGYGGGPLWRRWPALGCSAKEEEQYIKKNSLVRPSQLLESYYYYYYYYYYYFT